MEAPSQSQMIDQSSVRGGEGRPRWAENLVQIEGHRRTWKAKKREIVAELSVCWCARCQTAVGAGGCFWSLSRHTPMHPPHTHTPRRLLLGMEGQGHFIMLLRSIYQEHITSLGRMLMMIRLENIQTIRRHSGQGHGRPGPSKLCGTWSYPLGARTSAGVFTVPVSEPNPPSPGSLHLLNAAQRSWHSDLIS